MERRQFLKLSLVSLAVAATGSAVYTVADASLIIDGTFTDEASIALAAFVPVILYGVLPDAEQQRKTIVQKVITDVQHVIQTLPPATIDELNQLLILLSSRMAALIGLGNLSHVDALSTQQKMQLLNAWRDSYLDILQVAYLSIKEMVYAAFYGDPAHWTHLNYAKPQLGI